MPVPDGHGLQHLLALETIVRYLPRLQMCRVGISAIEDREHCKKRSTGIKIRGVGSGSGSRGALNTFL